MFLFIRALSEAWATRRLHAFAAAAAMILVGAAAGPGCVDEDAKARRAAEGDARVVVSFEGYVYVDVGASTPAVLDRVQHQQQSAVGSLRHQRIAVDARRQGVDVRSLVREMVRVVDGGSATQALRVRYAFKALGRVARSGARAEVPLGLLQNDATNLRAEIAGLCVPAAERDAETAASPWKSFDAALPGCQQAIAAEQRSITAARAGLASVAEVTAIERDRRFLPTVVRVRPRRPRGKGAPPGSRAQASAQARDEALHPPPPAASAVDPSAALDPLAAAPEADDGFDDVPDDDHGAPGIGDGEGQGDAPSGHADPTSNKWLEPNYYVLAFVAIALLVLLRRRR